MMVSRDETEVSYIMQTKRGHGMAVIALTLWSMLAVALLLTWAGLARGSWKQMALAAVLSLLFSVATMFSIGPFIFLTTCLQAGAALAIYRNAQVRERVGLLLGSVMVWVLVIAVPLAALLL